MPTTAPETRTAFLRVRLNPDLHAELKARAAAEHRSLPGEVAHIVTLFLSGKLTLDGER